MLSNSTRKRLIELLLEKPQTTGELCAVFSLSRFAIMQHLRVLENAGLIEVERRGRYRYNHLNTERLAYFEKQLAAEAGSTSAIASQQPGRYELSVERPLIEKIFTYHVLDSVLFDALTIHIGSWWRNDGASILLETQLGGRLWKQFDTSGSGVLFGIVDLYKRNELLGIMGTMGNDSAMSIIRFRFSKTKDGSQLQLTHQFVGKLSVLTFEAFEKSWQELLGNHLRVFLESQPPSA